MEVLDVFRVYLGANVALVVAWGLIALARARAANVRALPYLALLRFGYAAVIVSLPTPILGLFAPDTHLPNTAQVWSGPTMNGALPQAAPAGHLAVAVAPGTPSLTIDGLAIVLGSIFALGSALALARITRGLFVVRVVIRNAQTIRRHGRMHILSSDASAIPFSFWLPARHFIVLPTSLLATSRDVRIAIRHEGMHHRHGDTKMLYVFELLLGLCFWNPAVRRFVRSMRELQEFACDEALLQSPRMSAKSYCECLLRIAERAYEARTPVVCLSMAERSTDTVFIKRVESMLNRPRSYLNASKVTGLAIAGLAAMSLAAVSLAATVKDRRISLADAQRMASVAHANTEFPIVVNDSVVQELNRYVGTPDGRKFIRESLQRMQEHREVIRRKLEQSGLPEELLAVPLVESGYRNLPQGKNAAHGAGVWMFIAPTARRYSLRVDERTDERLNIVAETDAAVRMFTDLHRHFGDWGLALLAYNSGNALVEQGIRETGSRDAWTIVGHGYENDQDYLPRAMAAILIMRNPEVVE